MKETFGFFYTVFCSHDFTSIVTKIRANFVMQFFKCSVQDRVALCAGRILQRPRCCSLFKLTCSTYFVRSDSKDTLFVLMQSMSNLLSVYDVPSSYLVILSN